MKRYLLVLYTFYKAAILTDLEYRANFVVNLLLSVVSIGWSVIGASVFYLHTDAIQGWEFNDLLVVLGLFLFFLGIVEMVLVPNAQDLIEHIRLGTLDFILTKPLNSQFHCSLRRINIWRFTDVLIGLGLVLYGVLQRDQLPSLLTVVWFMLLCVCAILILYALIMILITSAFWFVQLENVMELLFTFYEAGRFPVTIFPNWLRVILTFIVPIAFVTTVPAAVLLDRVGQELAIWSVLFAAVLFTITTLFWRYAVRHYSSASS